MGGKRHSFEVYLLFLALLCDLHSLAKTDDKTRWCILAGYTHMESLPSTLVNHNQIPTLSALTNAQEEAEEKFKIGCWRWSSTASGYEINGTWRRSVTAVFTWLTERWRCQSCFGCCVPSLKTWRNRWNEKWCFIVSLKDFMIFRSSS